MGWYEGYKMESDKYIYFYYKKNGCSEGKSWGIIDKSTNKILPIYIIDDLYDINWRDDCNFSIKYATNSLDLEERNTIANIAYDVLKDWSMNEFYEHREIHPYDKNGTLLSYEDFCENIIGGKYGKH